MQKGFALIIFMLLIMGCGAQPWEERTAKKEQQDALRTEQTTTVIESPKPNKVLTVVLEQGKEQAFGGYTFLLTAMGEQIVVEIDGTPITLVPRIPQQVANATVTAERLDDRVRIELKEY